ncbi:MAG: Flp pilus assembly complex ATPase component TadA [Gemmatimonadaceae bacterium]|nr:Flp pilus assembly complex ATPase component TadA [Gemmatimonadaceae bacterium]
MHAHPSHPEPPAWPAGGEHRFRPAAAQEEVDNLRRYLAAAIERGATDVHLRAGDVVYGRIDGQLVPLETPVLSSVSTFEMVQHILSTSHHAPAIDDVRDFTGPWSAQGIARFRVSVLRQRSSFAIVMRVIPDELPSIESIGLPRAVADAVLMGSGIAIVTGGPGSGRASTVAAMVHHLNTNAPRRRHIVTIESAIEFLHKNNRCSITQREVGVDTDSFADGMRAALDQDADVIVVGALDDPELVALAKRGAEQGRLVIAKMTSPDVIGAIRVFLSALPNEEQEATRLQLTEMLRAVVAQRLLPRADGTGRVLAAEVLVMTPAVREVLSDPGRLGEMRTALANGHAEYGTQTIDQHLADLVVEGQVSFEVALSLASNSLDFELQLRGLRR